MPGDIYGSAAGGASVLTVTLNASRRFSVIGITGLNDESTRLR